MTRTTVAGTPYTPHVTQTSDGEDAYWYMDDRKTGDTNIPLLFFIHGSGGLADDFLEHRLWANLREWFIDNGWAIVEGLGGGAGNWGTHESRGLYQETFDWVDNELSIGPITVLGQSMGGVYAYYAASHSTFAHRVTHLMLHSATTDLIFRYEDQIRRPGYPNELNYIFGVTPTTEFDVAQFQEKAGDIDPMQFPLDSWDHVHVLQMWGTNDEAVPPEPHAIAWIEKYGAHALSVVPAPRVQGHDPTQANMDDIIAFLGSHAPSYQPETAIVVNTAYLVTPNLDVTPLRWQ